MRIIPMETLYCSIGHYGLENSSLKMLAANHRTTDWGHVKIILEERKAWSPRAIHYEQVPVIKLTKL